MKRAFVLTLAAIALAAVLPTRASASTPEPTDQGRVPAPKDRNNDNERPDIGPTTIGDDFRVDSTDDSIGAEVSTAGRQGSNGPVSFTGAGSTTPRCTHRPATYGEFPNVVPPDSVDVLDPASQVNRDNNGRAETGWVRSCNTNGAQDNFYWAAADIDPIDLVPDALANARTQLGAPQPNINPDPATGGIVNLGMWLAIADPGTATARAALGNVWARVDADPTSISIDLGNGDTVECDGLGTPIPDSAWEDIEQGPCGYTYRRSSPDDAPYQLTISTNYAIGYTTSTGQTGTLSPITRSATVDYDVDEIQTVGIDN